LRSAFRNPANVVAVKSFVWLRHQVFVFWLMLPIDTDAVGSYFTCSGSGSTNAEPFIAEV
jgi:hypothetical protein